ncbi:MAG: glycosyltransferase, partial [Clostridia bacterium]|nr:glycosyltransferase [Clostridia bacterium]
YIVTASQIPNWLDVTNSRIKIVNHDQILPKDVLPTFNSVAIETALHRIPDLAEHFLYANDDMFFGANVDKNFFFSYNK